MSLALLADGLSSTAAASAESRYTFNVPPSSPSAALASIAATTGAAIGWPGGLPALRLHAVHGTMTIEAALRALLEGTGFVAQRVSATAFRIVRAGPSVRGGSRPKTPTTAAAPTNVPQLLPPPVEIVVTGQKQAQVLRDVPQSLAVVMLNEPRIGSRQPGTRDVFDSMDGVSITNLGPGRNREFIRGVADSPFNGPSQSTVAVQLDESRITYDAPDPDLRLVDMQRVEVLKGPQGALYGSGALGGIYHMVTRSPDLDEVSGIARIGAEAVAHGGVGASADATLNLPLVSDKLAVRAVGYAAEEAGWIDDVGRKDDANSARVAGGRVALRWDPTRDWSLDVLAAIQDVDTRDSQYVTGTPGAISRIAPIAEPTDNNFKTVAATITGRIGGIDLLDTTSYVRQRVDVMLDSTAASAAFRLTGASLFNDHRIYQVFNHELRLSSSGRVRWLAGISYLDAHSDATGTVASRNTTLVVETRERRVREYAGFAEVTVPLLTDVTGTAGLRLSRSQTADEASVRAGGSEDTTHSTQLAPSAAISWKPDERTIVYVRYARAVRPGGLAPTGRALGPGAPATTARTRRFDSDELGTFDLGIRRGGGSDRLALSASAFATDWRHIQTDYLLANGLISTRNAGRARILGAEGSADWRPGRAWLLTLGMAYVDARLIRDETGKPVNARLPVTPDLTARARAQYGFALAGWEAKAEGQFNYVGSSRLSFDQPYDRKMGDFATVETGLVISRSRLAISLRIDNLFDANGNSFAFGNPFSIAAASQYTPQRPRTVSVSIARSW